MRGPVSTQGELDRVVKMYLYYGTLSPIGKGKIGDSEKLVPPPSALHAAGNAL
jgi:hypothetical protein